MNSHVKGYMKHIRIPLMLAALVIALLTSFAITSAQTTAEPLLIAVIGADEGTQGMLDQQMLQGAQLAADDLLEDDGAILGPDSARYRFEIVFYPASTAAEAVDAYKEAVQDGAVAILGPNVPAHLEAILDSDNPDIPILALNADDMTSNAVYQLAADPETMTEAVADYLQNERFLEDFAVVYANTATAQAGAADFIAAVDDDNVVLTLSHAADETDFANDARSIRQSGAGAVFIWTLDAPGARLLAALRATGWTGAIAYMELDDAFVAQTGADLTVDAIGAAAWSASAYDTASQAFVAAYTARFGSAPGHYAAAYYDAVSWLGAAVAEDGDEIDSLSRVDYSGIQGDYVDGSIDSVLLLEADSSGALIDLARYDEGACLNCPDIWNPDVADADVDSAETLIVALMTAQDGPAAAAGDAARQAAELAVREINNAGGFLSDDGDTRYTIRLLTYAVSGADSMQTAFDEALADGAHFIMGPDFNAEILPNLYLTEGAEMVQLASATGLSGSLVSLPDQLLQIRANDAANAYAAADYVLNTLGLTDMATVAVRTDYGLDGIAMVQDVIAESDSGRVVLALEHDVLGADYAALAGQIVASDAEAVLAWTTQPAAEGLLDALDAAGWQGVFVYGYLTESFMDSLLVVDGIPVVGPVSWLAVAGDWSGHEFVQRYTNRYGEAPLTQSAAYYDAVYLIRKAVQSAGTDADDLMTWLTEDLDFIGVQGSYAAAEVDNNALSQSVLMVGVGADGPYEIARYTAGVCTAWCE
jgi:branched-chain amino acid transport system substrate-binding protein